MAFADGGTFTVDGAPIGQDAARIALGTDVKVSETARFGVAYEGRFSDELTSHGIRASFRMSF